MSMQMLRTSERLAFRGCEQKWWWAYVEGLRSNMPPSNALWFGTGIHLAFAEFYIPGKVRGRNPIDTWSEYAKGSIEKIKTKSTYMGDEADEYESALELGVDMLRGYLDEYQGDPNWDVIAPEQTFSVLIPHPTKEGAITRYVGTFDGVYRDLEDDRVKMMEHKTAASIDTNHLNMDDQAGSYWAVATHVLRKQGKIAETEYLSGITYNFLRKAKGETRPRDKNGFYTNKPIKNDYVEQIVLNTAYGENESPEEDRAKLSKMKVSELQDIAIEMELVVTGAPSKNQGTPRFVREYVIRGKNERSKQIKRISNEAWRMKLIRQRKLPVIKSISKECNWCEFRDMCMTDEAGGDVEGFKKMAFHKEDPYMDHRAGADNSKKSVANDRRLKSG